MRDHPKVTDANPGEMSQDSISNVPDQIMKGSKDTDFPLLPFLPQFLP